MNDLILFGIQGSGKGTQAQKLADKYGYQIFETGGELRKLLKSDTDLGRKIKAIVERGDLVDNEIVMEIVSNFVAELTDGVAVLFDGLPRSIPQKLTFDALLVECGRTASAVCLHVPRDIAIERMLERGRDDDTEEVIERRLANYDAETLPVIEGYDAEGVLMTVDGTQSIEEVFTGVCAELDK